MNLLDFLFPPQCPHCGAHVVTQGNWCEACIDDVLHIRQVPTKFLKSIDAAWILADYRGGIKSIIYDVKFNEKKEQSKGAAPFLASYNLYVHEYKPHYIIPIPSNEEKKKVRGYNQVDLFFKSWASELETDQNKIILNHKEDAEPYFKASNQDDRYKIDSTNSTNSNYYAWLDCLYKMDTHKDMWSLSGTERQETIARAFMWNCKYDESLIKGKRILLVDDIYTTGATLEAAGKILREKNPEKIEALTLASGSF